MIRYKGLNENKNLLVNITPTSSGKYIAYDPILLQRIYKKNTTTPIVFNSEIEAKEYAIKFLNKKHGKQKWTFDIKESGNPFNGFMNREAFDLYNTYKNKWSIESTWENFVKKNKSIFEIEVKKIKNTTNSISNEKARNKKFKVEMRNLQILLTDIWKVVK